jgi:hypothetical protein
MANLGTLTATGDQGRVLAQRDTSGPRFAMAVADVPVHHRSTLYSRFGNGSLGQALRFFSCAFF